MLRIDAPYLFVNGKIAPEWVFQRVMSGLNGYRGYSNMYQFPYLSTPAETYTVPEHGYSRSETIAYFPKTAATSALCLT
jgi:hypothetical protein